MANFNKVFLMGNLTRDPEQKFLPSGTPVTEFGLAVNRRWRDQSGQDREATTFVDCKSMGRQSEVLHQYLSKGRPVFIEGRLDFRAWEAKDGTRRSKLEVFVENFQFIDGRRDSEGGGGGGGGGRPERVRGGAPARDDDQGGPARDAGSDGYLGGEEDAPF